MKYLFILSTVILFLIGCNTDSHNTDLIADTYFKGQINNPVGDKLFLSSGEWSKEIQVATDGTFADTLQKEAGYYRIRHGREYGVIFIEPGQHQTISVDMDSFDESISFEGNGAPANNYLAKKLLNQSEIMPSSKELFSLTASEFLKKLEEIKKTKTTFLESREGLDASFVDTEKQNFEYEMLRYISDYTPAHAHYTDNDDFETPDEVTEILGAVDFDNEEHYQKFLSYERLIHNYFGIILEGGKNTAGFLEAVKSISSPLIKSGLLSSVSYFVKPGNDDAEALYNEIMTHSNDAELKEKLTKKFELIKTLVKGKPSPSFNYVDINGKQVKLEDLAGKHVYIDVWATWCGPCKAEIPHLKEMETAHHGKNIEFVSISIDKQNDMEKWEQMVVEKELQGIQLFADKDWKSDFVKNYAIEGIPRFILVDADGKIVSPDAPRPSQREELLALFEETGVQ